MGGAGADREGRYVYLFLQPAARLLTSRCSLGGVSYFSFWFFCLTYFLFTYICVCLHKFMFTVCAGEQRVESWN